MIDVRDNLMNFINSVITLTNFHIADSHSLIISSGFSIVLSIIIWRLDKKTRDFQAKITNEIHSFTEKQDQINRSYLKASLTRISQYLEFLIGDLDRSVKDLEMQSSEKEKISFVTDILNGNHHYKWKIDSIQHETEIVRNFINSQIYYEIINTVKNVAYLTDTDHFRDDNIKATAWSSYCKRAITQSNNLLSKIKDYSCNL